MTEAKTPDMGDFKTREELLKMGFKAVREYAAQLGVDTKFGSTKPKLVALIIDKQKEFLPPEPEKPVIPPEVINAVDPRYSDNAITLDEAHNIFQNVFGDFDRRALLNFASGFEQTPPLHFGRSIIHCELLEDVPLSCYSSLNYLVTRGHTDAAVAQLQGFIAPPTASHAEKILFELFRISKIENRLTWFERYYTMIGEFNECERRLLELGRHLDEIAGDEVMTRVFIGTMIISKFRMEDFEVNTYRNAENFLHALVGGFDITPREKFQADRFDKVKKKGGKIKVNVEAPTIDMFEVMKKRREITGVSSFGGNNEPQAEGQAVKAFEKEEIQGISSDKKDAIKNQLAAAFGNARTSSDDTKEVDPNGDEETAGGETEPMTFDDVDVAKYDRMIKFGQSVEVVRNRMVLDGIPKDLIDQYFRLKEGPDDEKEQPMENGHAEGATEAPAIEVPEALIPFKNMLDRGVPLPGVLNRMRRDGIDDETIAQFERDFQSSGPPPVPAASGSSITGRMTSSAPPLVGGAIPAPPPAVPAAPPGWAGMLGPGMPGAPSDPPKKKKFVLHDNVGLVWKNALSDVEGVGFKVQIVLTKMRNERGNAITSGEWNPLEEKEGSYDYDCYEMEPFEHYERKFVELGERVDAFAELDRLTRQKVENLFEIYHKQFRMQMFQELSEPTFTAIVDAVELLDVGDLFTLDVIGVVWLFIKPFDEMVDLRFAVTQIKTFWDAKKAQLKKDARQRIQRMFN